MNLTRQPPPTSSSSSFLATPPRRTSRYGVYFVALCLVTAQLGYFRRGNVMGSYHQYDAQAAVEPTPRSSHMERSLQQSSSTYWQWQELESTGESHDTVTQQDTLVTTGSEKVEEAVDAEEDSAGFEEWQEEEWQEEEWNEENGQLDEEDSLEDGDGGDEEKGEEVEGTEGFYEPENENEKTEHEGRDYAEAEQFAEHVATNGEAEEELLSITSNMTNTTSTNGTAVKPLKMPNAEILEQVVEAESVPLHCQYNAESKRQECCAPWEVNADAWWLHKPDWEVSLENATHYCLSPMPDDDGKASFVRQIHDLQWGTNCSVVRWSHEVSAGYGAATTWLLESFFKAYQDNLPFQIAFTPHRWNFAPNRTSPLYCESQDIYCYVLPLSPCTRRHSRRHHDRQAIKVSDNWKTGHWLKQYMMRPNHLFRRKLWEMRQTVPVQLPCTTMHVRRTDAAFPRPPYRRYAAVIEYIEAANILEGDNIFLMTDDQTTIEEIHKHLPNYNWTYMVRPRGWAHKGGWEGHVPSGDGAHELLVIHTEFAVASSCSKLVYGESGFMKSLQIHMKLEGRDYKKYLVDTKDSKQNVKRFRKTVKGYKPEVRAMQFLKQIEMLYKNRALAKATLNTTHHDNDTTTTETKPEKETKRTRNKGLAVRTDHQGSLTYKAAIYIDVNATTPADVNTDKNPLECSDTETGPECCGSWDIDADTSWWLHHPDWEVSSENGTHYCFKPIQDAARATFVRTLHERQWMSGDCSEALVTREISSGFGASTSWILYAYWAAIRQSKPFLLVKPTRKWKYAPQDNESVAFCEEYDITCYYLPFSPCPRDVPFKKEDRQERRPRRGWEFQQLEWLRDYLFRPKQVMRRKIFEMRQTINVAQPCTAVHVRRGDVGFPRPPFRRYASVQEYIDVGEVKNGENIFLLTDDHSTIEEIHEHHPEFNWTYVDRKRNKGVDGGWESHVPSGDGATEMVILYAELQVAATCRKFVYGTSGFIQIILKKLNAYGIKYESYRVKNGVSKTEKDKWPQDGQARVEYFFSQMEEYRRLSRERKSNATKAALNLNATVQ